MITETLALPAPPDGASNAQALANARALGAILAGPPVVTAEAQAAAAWEFLAGPGGLRRAYRAGRAYQSGPRAQGLLAAARRAVAGLPVYLGRGGPFYYVREGGAWAERRRETPTARLNQAFRVGPYLGQWCEAPDSVFRFAGLASDLDRDPRGPLGFYCDSFCDETARGVVYQMTGRDGRARFIPGVADPCNADADGTGPAVLFLGDMVEGPGDDSDSLAAEAAQAAHGAAEAYAEAERAFHAADQAGLAFAEAGDAIAEARREFLALRREAREAAQATQAAGARSWDSGVPTALCAALRRRLGDLLDSIREAREARERLREGEGPDNYGWDSRDPHLRAVFAETAGLAAEAV